MYHPSMNSLATFDEVEVSAQLAEIDDGHWARFKAHYVGERDAEPETAARGRVAAINDHVGDWAYRGRTAKYDMTSPGNGAEKNLIIETFDRLAQEYDSYIAPGTPLEKDFRAQIGLVLRLCRRYVRPRVLDIGCGTGRHLMSLAPAIREGVGADTSPAMVARAQANAQRAGHENLLFTRADAVELAPKQLGHFDVIMLIGTLEHILEPDAALRRAVSLLARGGRIVVIVPHKANLAFLWKRLVTGRRPVIFESDRIYGVRDLKSLARAVGLTATRIYPLPFAVRRVEFEGPPWLLRALAAVVSLIPLPATRGAFAILFKSAHSP